MENEEDKRFQEKRLSKRIIYGPIRSRRLENSLGVNLMPEKEKLCSFDCVYCECGFSSSDADPQDLILHDSQTILNVLEAKLKELKAEHATIDSITFSGNGEPTLHTEFPKIIDGVISLRNEYYPKTKITVLSNATTIIKPSVVEALRRIDSPVLKLDSAVTATMRAIDMPHSSLFNSEDLIDELMKFGGNVIIQTILISGYYNGIAFDNTADEEVSAYIEALRRINPRMVMLYALDRKAPVETLRKVSADELNKVADKIRKLGIDVVVAG